MSISLGHDAMFPINDAIDAILAGTFLFGVVFTVFSLMLGFADIGIHGGDGNGHDVPGHHGIESLINVSSVLAFLTWFGGVGYLVRNAAGATLFISLLAAIAAGLLGGYIVATFVNRVLKAGEDTLDPAEYERVGVIARVSSSIREGGVGEIVFEQGGTRQVAAARSSRDLSAISRGTEVVILKVDRGTAIVEPFDELLAASP